MKLSYIICAYNVEEYLEQCIQSVLDSWDGIKEVILVIGNSADKSNTICRRFEERYNEIIIIQQNGRGLSNARNCGMEKATGDYILFIDGDDYVDSASLKKRLVLLEKFENKVDFLASDFISIGINEEEKKVSRQIKKDEQIHTNTDFEYGYLNSDGSIWNVWRYIYRTDFLKNNRLFFEENIKCEDVLFTTEVFMTADIAAYYHLPYYIYRVRRKGALTTHIDSSYLYDFLNVVDKGIKKIETSNQDKTDKALYLRAKLQREYILNMANICEVAFSDRKNVISRYKENIGILKNGSRRIYKIVYAVLNVTGLYIPSVLLFNIRKIRRKRFWII